MLKLVFTRIHMRAHRRSSMAKQITFMLLVLFMIMLLFVKQAMVKLNIEHKSDTSSTELVANNDNQPVQPPLACPQESVQFLDLACIPTLPSSAAHCGEIPASFSSSHDFCQFYTSKAGIVTISNTRWAQAQSVESSVWDGNAGGEDRNEQHAGWFEHYNALNSSLGRVLEIGSGPFTQTKTVISKIIARIGSVDVESITLADPLMLFYHTRVPSCPYKDGSLLGYRTQFIASGGEDLLLRAEYDTVIMINVLEHCRDALRVLHNLHNAVKKETGVLIFSERWYDTKWSQYERNQIPFWDVMHPINIKKTVVDTLLQHYKPIHRRDFFYSGNYPEDEGVYFIGIKK